MDRTCVNNHDCDRSTDTTGHASATSHNSSIGTSFGVTSYDGLEPTLAEYHKKDLTIWDHTDFERAHKHEQTQEEEQETSQRPVCIRVQLWDMNIPPQALHQHREPDSNSSVVSTSLSLRSPRPVADITPLLPLLTRLHGVIIVCRCPLPPTSVPRASDASSDVSHVSGEAAQRDWAELRAVERQIRQWTTFLRGQGSAEHRRPILCVSLSCGDLALAGYAPRDWRQLSVTMAALCKHEDIEAWQMGTCLENSGGASAEFSHAPHCTLLNRKWQQQSQMLEAMEDAVEAAFIAMLHLHLKRTREVQKLP